MTFFGFQEHDLEQDRHNFLDGGESEDLAVYTWGEESYDGLGDALQEGGDDLNDETFGGSGKVGKDFDFSNPSAPGDDRGSRQQSVRSDSRNEQVPVYETSTRAAQPARSTNQSLESIWDDKSPFSVLPRANGGSRAGEHNRLSSPAGYSAYQNGSSPLLHQQQPVSHGHTGVRTLQDIEEEMQAAAQQSRGEALRQQQQQQHEYLLQHQQQLMLQQQQQQLLLQQQQQQLLQQQHQHQRTPPPRMMPTAQSPRFHERQRQIQLLQQQQEIQQQQRLQELQEQLQMEELERQLRAQQISQTRASPDLRGHQRQASGPSLIDLQTAQLLQQQLQQQRRQQSRSPAYHEPQFQVQVPAQLQQTQQGGNMHYMPQNVQLQQRLLAEMVQAELIRDMQGATTQAEQEALRTEAMRKIMEAERMEEKRRRKAAKIAHMARYNDLMTQSDKDFITRIQVSQLVTQDPYADDFYAQVYGAILRSRLGLQSHDERVLKFGSGGGVGLGSSLAGQKNSVSGSRRPSAMQRMEAQVERIVSAARLREKEKGLHSIHSLAGALGKTSGRSYKAAPRQLLQVDGGNTSPTLSHAYPHIHKEEGAQKDGAAREAAKLGREALGNAADTDGLVRQDPLSQRQTLVILENLYDVVLKVEQLRRDQPSQEEEEVFGQWTQMYTENVEQLWDGLKVMVPLETSDPHPFISLITPTKGKKLLPRLSRHLNSQQMLTMLTLLVACFNQLDVIIQAPLLDLLEDTLARKDVERQTQAFLGSVLQSILPVVAKANLRLVSGLLGLLLDRSDIVAVTASRPGLALLTLFLSRVEVIKQSMGSAVDASEIPTPEEAQDWEMMLNHLFQLLAPHFLRLFPSTRLAHVLPPASTHARPTDIIDQPVWQFLAALALHASPEQQQILVTALREKVLENVLSANKGWVVDEDERQTKLANVNLFLHALGLDSSQISL